MSKKVSKSLPWPVSQDARTEKKPDVPPISFPLPKKKKPRKKSSTLSSLEFKLRDIARKAHTLRYEAMALRRKLPSFRSDMQRMELLVDYLSVLALEIRNSLPVKRSEKRDC